jgi:hypothetical protein
MLPVAQTEAKLIDGFLPSQTQLAISPNTTFAIAVDSPDLSHDFAANLSFLIEICQKNLQDQRKTSNDHFNR